VTSSYLGVLSMFQDHSSLLADQVELISQDSEGDLNVSNPFIVLRQTWLINFCQECLLRVGELKTEGNDHFRVGSWDEALAAYRAGLGRLPKRKDKSNGGLKGKEKNDGDSLPHEEEAIAEESGVDDGVSTAAKEELPETDLERQCAKARAVLNGNIGACYVKLVNFPAYVHRHLLHTTDLDC